MKQAEAVSWIVFIGLVGLGMGLLLVFTSPSADSVSRAVQPLPPLDTTVFDGEALSLLKNREVNGVLPVAANEPEPPRADPFN